MNVWNSGPEFHINEIPGSDMILPEEADGSRYVINVDLKICKDDDWVNPLWVTRCLDGRLMLHFEEEPTRMRDSDEYKLRKNSSSWAIKKNGRKWTSWKGHFRVPPFDGSEDIHFEDEYPTKVIVVIPDNSDIHFLNSQKKI